MSAAEEAAAKKEWTEEERLALAAKLDAELDEFIDGLEKKRYSEGWPEDRWQEEMDKHPFFMKRAPQPGDEVHPMFEGLQKLKYDPEENTAEELALNYKEDGNFYMKHKKFRMAIYSFTEGIKTKCANANVMAVLYNNRSAAHYFLQNYRSALEDAMRALILKADYAKARMRAAECALKIDKFDLCQSLCEQLLSLQPDTEQQQKAKNMLKASKDKKLQFERDARKAEAMRKKQLTRFQLLCEKLQERQVKFDDLPNAQQQQQRNISEQLLKPKFLPLEDNMVHLEEDDEQQDTLIWPAAFSYPEFLLSDFQQQLSEHVVMSDCLQSLFAEPMPCDKNYSYRPDNVNVYYENRKVGCLHKVNLQKSIKDIIQEKGFFVSGGTLLFYVVPIGSRIEQEFLHQQRRPMVYS